MDIYGQARDLHCWARGLMGSGSLEEAVSLYCESAALHPHFKTLELPGECLCRLERWNEAVIPLAAATALNQQVRAPSLLAQTFLKLGDNDRALKFAEMALAREENNRLALYVRQIAVERRQEELRSYED